MQEIRQGLSSKAQAFQEISSTSSPKKNGASEVEVDKQVVKQQGQQKVNTLAAQKISPFPGMSHNVAQLETAALHTLTQEGGLGKTAKSEQTYIKEIIQKNKERFKDSRAVANLGIRLGKQDEEEIAAFESSMKGMFDTIRQKYSESNNILSLSKPSTFTLEISSKSQDEQGEDITNTEKVHVIARPFINSHQKSDIQFLMTLEHIGGGQFKNAFKTIDVGAMDVRVALVTHMELKSTGIEKAALSYAQAELTQAQEDVSKLQEELTANKQRASDTKVAAKSIKHIFKAKQESPPEENQKANSLADDEQKITLANAKAIKAEKAAMLAELKVNKALKDLTIAEGRFQVAKENFEKAEAKDELRTLGRHDSASREEEYLTLIKDSNTAVKTYDIFYTNFPNRNASKGQSVEKNQANLNSQILIQDLYSDGELDQITLYYPDMGDSLKDMQISMFQQMAQELNNVHLKELVHGDIKVNNFVMAVTNVTDEGVPSKVKVGLIDGGAVELANDKNKLSILGTPQMWPPEHIHNRMVDMGEMAADKVEVGKPKDVWALGIAFYQMLHVTDMEDDEGVYTPEMELPPGVKEWADVATSPDVQKRQAALEKIGSLLEPPKSDALEHLVWEMLQVDPNQRPTMQSVVNRLKSMT